MFLDDKPQGTPAVEPVKVGTLKLSTAIRIGATMHPQGMCYERDGTTCAWGAAAYGTGYTRDQGLMLTHLEAKFPEVFGTELGLEIHGRNVMRDHKGYGDYEAIADWLESQGY